MPIQWTTKLALGIADLDAQQLELDRQLAMVHDAICAGRVPDLAAVLEGVRSCSSRHFESEEGYMLQSAYPDVDAHRAEHREFTRQLAGFEEARTREGANMRLAMEIGNWLAGWMREHQRKGLALAAHLRATKQKNPGEGAP